jgi:hypothetical protein
LSAEFIPVNVNRPELTPGPFSVHHIDRLVDKEVDMFTHEGYLIMIHPDHRDVFGTRKETVNGKTIRKRVSGFNFKAYLTKTTEILVVGPLLSWGPRGNDDEAIRRGFSGTIPSVVDALDHTRNDFIERMGGVDKYNSAVKHYVLQFSSDIHLDAKCL